MYRNIRALPQRKVMSLDERSESDERLKNSGQKLLLETVELLDVNELCRDDTDDAW